MASPQKERGYVPIANELLDAICRADLSKQELKVLLCIIRFTYGYNRKQALISLNTIQKYTSIRLDTSILKKQQAIISSMTKAERRTPSIIKASRKKRIAAGSGTTVQDVNILLKQFDMMSTMMKRLSRFGMEGLMRQGMSALMAHKSGQDLSKGPPFR